MENRIRELREGMGLTQDELSKRLKVSRQTVNSLENGRYDPSIKLAFALAKAFGRTIEEIFIYEGEES